MPGRLLTTPGQRRPPRSGRHPRGSSSRQRWRMDPRLQHLVATTRKKGKEKKGEKATVSTHPKYSRLLSPYFPPFPSTWLSQPDVGAQEQQLGIGEKE